MSAAPKAGVDRLVLASPGGWDAPSARYRFGPLRAAGIWQIDAVSAGSAPTPAAIEMLLELGGDRAALVLHRALPGPADLERLRGHYPHLIFDFDDALYAVPPDLSRTWIRQLPKRAGRLLLRRSVYASARKRPLEDVLRSVDVCVGGNSILTAFAQRFARRVFEIPTTVRPLSEPPRLRESPPVVVWMGLADNLQYLKLVGGALRRLHRQLDFTFRVVSTTSWKHAPIPVEFVPWSEHAMTQALSSASVGLAPLTDEPWTRGKCAFRAIQYGGHALPTVASPVGVTDRVVVNGKTGFLAETSDDWENALQPLLTNGDLVADMGAAALRHIQENYSDAVGVAAWHGVIDSLDS